MNQQLRVACARTTVQLDILFYYYFHGRLNITGALSSVWVIQSRGIRRLTETDQSCFLATQEMENVDTQHAYFPYSTIIHAYLACVPLPTVAPGNLISSLSPNDIYSQPYPLACPTPLRTAGLESEVGSISCGSVSPVATWLRFILC
jgi:hypothetical protein